MAVTRGKVCLLVIAAIFTTILPAQRRPLTFEDFLNLDAVSDLQLAPDGRTAAFVVTDYSLEGNRGNTDIWVVQTRGGIAQRLTRNPGTDNQPRWSPDGRWLAFVSDRSGSNQIHIMPPQGGEARKISDLKESPANLTWSPDGRWLAFSADVPWPPEKTDSKDPFPSTAKVTDELFYRHWNEWRVGVRSHVFVMRATGGVPKDITPWDEDYPTLALGGYQDLVFTPDSRSVAITANLEEPRAANTNNDILLVPVGGGAAVNLTEGNPANDNNPLFSRNGKYMAYRAQLRAGFEADRQHLMLLDRTNGRTVDLTRDWPLSVEELAWSPDEQSLYALVEEQARNVLYRISLPDGKRDKVVAEGYNQDARIMPDGKTVLCRRETANRPAEVFSVDLDTGAARQLTQVNDALVSQIEMNPVEEFWFDGARNDRIHGLLLKPPAFNPERTYPLVYLIHGGPQGAMQDNFHPRWNYQMFAAPGYVVAMVNFHGSTGYGQDFTDSISGHWGDYPYEDLMKGVDHLLATYPFIDKQRVAAAGASYGGYMIYWLATQTQRFNCLISHDGVFDPESMYGSTEELWFPEWEFGGTPWNSRDIYRRWSPQEFSGNMRTPMLVVHGQLDYRVDVSQGFQAFTALKRQGIESRLLYFPDEGHFVTKPRNRRVWWREMLGWLAKYLKQS